MIFKTNQAAVTCIQTQKVDTKNISHESDFLLLFFINIKASDVTKLGRHWWEYVDDEFTETATITIVSEGKFFIQG